MGRGGLLRFGDFTFDPATGELERNGERVRLEPQPAKALALLAERSGRLVTHEELRRHLWGEETFVDFERGLRTSISQVRGALGDAAETPLFIETLPRRGYRFLLPVEGAAPDVPAEVGGPAEGGPRAGRPAPRLRRFLLPAALALAVAGGLLAFTVGVVKGRRAGPGPAPALRLAVVPFDNETGSPDHDAVARGLSDAAVARLTAIDPARLAVVGNAALLFQPREDRDLEEISRRLDVQYLVLGQLQEDGGRVRVVVHLLRASDQAHLWATRIEKEALDALALEREVAEEAAAAVVAHLPLAAS